jgi:2-polyprenyl-6-methoxyphenol hydroxylase-like FAD-dependent oxidoreductase
MKQIGGQAVVLGAGMAGLLTARVLAGAYRRVTVVERDPLPQMPANRKGVPQGRHAHLLVPRGAQILDELFPGLPGELAAGGAPVIGDYGELRFAPGGHLLRLVGRPAQPFVCQASRPRLEAHVRARIRALPTVQIADECDILGLDTTTARDRVTGVRIARRAAGGAEDTLGADLVIDATGRSGRMPAWLAAIGYDQPPEERLAIHLKYATRHLRLHPGTLGGAKVIGVGAEPARPTGLVLFAQEGDRWILTAFGYSGHHPPTDPEGFLGFVQAAAPADVFAAICDGEPLDDIVAYQFPANVRRRYERLRFPAGLLVIGDAICPSNPAYALGMSVAALQAAALRDSLACGDRDLARRFFRAAAKPADTAWQLAAGTDLSLPQVKGPRPLPVRATNAYVNRALTAAEHDPVVAERFLRVASLQDPPSRMFRPATALRVALGYRRRRRVPAIEATTGVPASAPRA